MWTAIAAALGVLILLVVVANVCERRRHRRIAEGRDSYSEAQFLAALESRGVVGDTAQFVWVQIQPYYFAPLTPHPDDDLIDTIKVDPEDLGDDASEYARRFGFDWPNEVGPAWPDPVTPTSFALWLDELRAASRQAQFLAQTG